MTDTFLLEDEPHVLEVPAAAAVPPATITAPEWTALKGRVTAVEGLGLVDLTDVDPAGLADGLTLLYDATAGIWKPGAPSQALRAQAGGAASQFGPVTLLDARTGLTVTQHPTLAHVALLEPVYGTAANTIAAGNHTHTQPADVPFEIAESGDVSAGTRPLTDGSVTGLSPDRSYLLTASLVFDVRGSGTGAGFGTARIILNGVTSARPRARVVSGVDREITWSHAGVVVSGVSSVAVSATFQHDGASDPIYCGAGRLTVSRRPYR